MVRLVGVTVTSPEDGDTLSHEPNGGELTATAAVNARLPVEVASATVCGAGAPAPATELNVRTVGETARLCAAATVRFTVTVCCPFAAPSAFNRICAV